MGADSEPETKGFGDPLPDDKRFYWRVRDVREDFGRRIEELSAKCALTIAHRLRLAYYQNVLRLYESLSPDTKVHAGYGMSRHCSDHQEEVREIIKILTYLFSEEEITTGLTARPGSMSALPASARLFSRKRRPVTQRPAALRALQLQIDTGQTWSAITPQVCGCVKTNHDRFCTENIRQGVNGLKRCGSSRPGCGPRVQRNRLGGKSGEPPERARWAGAASSWETGGRVQGQRRRGRTSFKWR
jgi:hypothetical protein